MDNERNLTRLIEALKEPVQLDPDFDERVMGAIADDDDSRRVTGATWLRRRTIRLSPIGAGALAAGIAVVALLGSNVRRAAQAPQPAVIADTNATPTTTDSVRVMQFVLVEPSARSVAVVGDFNDWDLSATPLAREQGDGVWWVALPLSPGRYRYAFVVNGTRWQGDPDAPSADDEFGRPSSVVSIGGV